MSLRFEDAVAAALEGSPPETIRLAAVSGGADSVAMLAALAAVARESERGGGLRCIHVEHGIRPEAESRGDADFVRSLCEKLRLPCCVVSIKPGKVAETAKKRGVGIEAAARFYRHRAWSREAARLEDAGSGPVRILVAHTADDMLETVLMRVLRGAGPSGLAAMPAGRGRILRPLLALSRGDVLAYLAEKGIPWREDSTNSDMRYLRNRVRHCLVPPLAKDFPQWRSALSSLAETQALAADFVVSEANLRIKWRVSPSEFGAHVSGGFARKSGAVRAASLCTDEGNFFAQPAIVREEALFQGVDALLAGSAAAAGFTREVRRANVRRFSAGEVSAMDLGRVRLRRKGGEIVLSRREKRVVSECGFSFVVVEPGVYNFNGMALEISADLSADAGESAFFAALPLVLRPSFKEDRIGRIGYGAGEVISAVDALGVAAFLGKDGALRGKREAPQVAGEGLCVVRGRSQH